MLQSLKLHQKSIDFRMAFKAKKGHKRTELWVWPLPKTSIELVRLVANRESAIIGIFQPFNDFAGKTKQM